MVTEEPVVVSTVLGSCVSATMYHKRSGLAAICHGMLPKGGSSDSFKYVDTSLRYMLNYFERLAVPKKEIQVKIFGGADMFNSAESGARNLTVGWQNVLVANSYFESFGMTVTASDVGGQRGRKVIFQTDTGIVLVKRMTGQK